MVQGRLPKKKFKSCGSYTFLITYNFQKIKIFHELKQKFSQQRSGFVTVTYAEVEVIFGSFVQEVIGSFAKSMCTVYKCNLLLMIFHIFLIELLSQLVLLSCACTVCFIDKGRQNGAAFVTKLIKF